MNCYRKKIVPLFLVAVITHSIFSVTVLTGAQTVPTILERTPVSKASLSSLGVHSLSPVRDFFNQSFLYENGDLISIIYGGAKIDERINVDSVEIIEIVEKSKKYIVLLGFTYSFDYILQSAGWEEIDNDRIRIISSFGHDVFYFNFSLRMPVELIINYPEPMIENDINSVTVSIKPLDYKDFNEFICDLSIINRDIISYHASFTTPIGKRNAFVPFTIGPYFPIVFNALLADVKLGFQIEPQIYSNNFQCNVEVSGDGKLESSNLLIWSDEGQKRMIEVFTGDFQGVNEVYLFLNEFKLYLDKFNIDLALVMELSIIGYSVRTPPYTLISYDMSWILHNMPAIGVHPNSQTKEIQITIPVETITRKEVKIDSSWYGFTLEIDWDGKHPYLYNFQTSIDGDKKPICVGQDLDPLFNDRYYRGFAYWSTEKIPDIADIISVKLLLHNPKELAPIISNYISSQSCNLDIYSMELNPSSYGRHNPGNNLGRPLFDDAFDGNLYVTRMIESTETNKWLKIPLGIGTNSAACLELKSLLGENWFAVGFHESTEKEYGVYIKQNDRGVNFWGGKYSQLVVTYRAYSLTVKSDYGDVFGQGVYDPSSKVEFGVKTQIIESSTNTRHIFTGWTSNNEGGYNGKDLSRTITLYQDIVQTAIWETQHYVDLQTSEGGKISKSPGWFNERTILSLKATSNNNYRFYEWKVNGKTYSNLSEISVEVDKPLNIVATFQKIPKLELVIQSEHGSTSGSGLYTIGTKITVHLDNSVIVQDKTRFVFKGWSYNGPSELVSIDPSCEIILKENTTMTALWEEQYYITVKEGTGGTVNIGSGWYPKGKQLTLIATPQNRYSFIEWKGLSESLRTSNNQVLSVESALDIEAVFLEEKVETIKSYSNESENQSFITGYDSLSILLGLIFALLIFWKTREP